MTHPLPTRAAFRTLRDIFLRSHHSKLCKIGSRFRQNKKDTAEKAYVLKKKKETKVYSWWTIFECWLEHFFQQILRLTGSHLFFLCAARRRIDMYRNVFITSLWYWRSVQRHHQAFAITCILYENTHPRTCLSAAAGKSILMQGTLL